MSATHDPESGNPAFSGVFSRTFVASLVLAGVLIWVSRGYLQRDGLDPDATPRAVTPRGDLAADERSTIELFQEASPAVVHIETTRIQAVRDFWDVRYFEVPEGTGSGFLWDDEGHVVTNFHVVRGAASFRVRLQDGSSYPGQLVGQAEDYDLAVLSIDVPARRLHSLPIGASGDLRVGQKVFAIGNPFGLDQTLTTGVISGLNRAIRSESNEIRGVIQTDAAINPGNSGGPLLDSAGRLIGVNTAIATLSGDYAGVGFAVPVDTVNHVVPRILREGNVERAGLGIKVESDLLAQDAGIQGAVVGEVIDGSAAYRAGLRGTGKRADGSLVLGDVIVGVGGREIRGAQDLFQSLEEYRPGDEVRLRVSRAGRQGRRVEEITVQLQAMR